MPRSSIKKITKSYIARFAAWVLVHNFVDLLAMALPIRLEQSERKRVVFVKLDGVGDYIIWTSVFYAIAEKYPSAEFERILVVNERCREFAQECALFDKKIYADVIRLGASASYRFKLMRRVRELGAAVIVNPRLTRDFLWGDSVVRVSGAAERIGSEGIENLMSPMQERLSARWYTELLPAPQVGVHELISSAEFIGFASDGIQPRIEARADNQLETPYAVIFVGAFTADKRWPMAKFAAAARAIADEHRVKIVLCGGPGEQHLADEFGKFYKGEFSNLIGTTSFLELSAIIRDASLTISNDTAAGHIAVAQRCPSVVITPGNHVGRFFPYPDEKTSRQISVIHQMPCFGCGWHCIYTDLAADAAKPCIANVEVENVVEAARRLMTTSV
ncbi:MAG: glycosyltransferase family 9 protein [Pyrinomonadaceae bacterium]